MRVCLIGHEYPDIMSGTGRYIENIMKFMPKSVAIDLITPYTLCIKKGIDPRIQVSSEMKKIIGTLNTNNYDLIHIVDVRDAWFLKKKLEVPVIINANDIYAYQTPWNPFKFPYPCSSIVKKWLYYNLCKIINNRYFRKADLILANSLDVKQFLEKKFDVRLMYKGVDIEKFRPGKCRRKNVLFAGGNSERKGIDRFIESIKLAKRLMDIKYEVVDSKKPVEPDIMPSLYQRASLYVLPAYIENLPQTIMEAMATETPVIATNVGGIGEIVREGTGYLLEDEDIPFMHFYILKILANKKLAREMGRKGRSLVKKEFNARTMVRNLVELYEGLL